MGVNLSALLALSLIVLSQITIARTIWIAGSHHETMTLDSMYCAEESALRPDSCPARPKDWKGALDLSKIGLGHLSQRQAGLAVRFPDDPVSELRFSNPVGLLRWGWNMGVSGCAGKSADIKTGLRCSAHYGDFQFMHAMSAKENIDPEITKDEITAWVRYLLFIIQNKQQPAGLPFIEQSYCEYWKTQQLNGNPIGKVMLPGGVLAFPCVVNHDSPWTIASMFAFECTINIYQCNVDLTPQNAKRKAIGSILHLIQDSFSQGHALRGDCCYKIPDEQLAAYQCAEINQFNAYQNQNKDRHESADKKPFPGKSCNGDSVINDPITSGAIVLWELKNSDLSDDAIDKLIDYLDSHVIKLSEKATPSGPGAGF
jgi:hypothetical protein